MPLLPDDLRPLPTRPYEIRPATMPLEVEECRTALWRSDGNVTEAAALLKVSSARLRTFIKTSPFLQREVEEAREQLIDVAEDVVKDALKDPERQDAAARLVLTTIGRSRGWGNGNTKVDVNGNNGPITLSWADGTKMEIGANRRDAQREEKVIEGEVVGD